jgi:hypothetical protein
MSFYRLITCALLIPLLWLSIQSHATAEQRWQLKISYSASSIKIISAEPVYEKKSKRYSPGTLSASELIPVHVYWKMNGRVIYSSKGELPFGNRFEHSCSVYGDECVSNSVGTTVLRIDGPSRLTEYNSIDIIKESSSELRVVPTEIAHAVPPLASFVKRAPIKEPSSVESFGPVSVTPLHITGDDANRFVMVILGDGFTFNEIQSGYLEKAARNISDYLATQSPWDKLWGVTNVYLINVVSPSSLINDPQGLIIGNSYFETSFNRNNIDRLIAPSALGKTRAVNAADAYIGVGVWDSIIILANSTKYGGSGGMVATVSLHPLSPEVTVHELGHTVAGLADEYESSYPGYPSNVTEPNVDTNGSDPKWSVWLDNDTPLPTPRVATFLDSVGAFEGARYQSQGVYRPMDKCKMRTLGVDFCPICKEAIVTGVITKLSLIDKVLPQRSTVILGRRKVKFSAAPVPMSGIVPRWSVCGRSRSTKDSQLIISRQMLGKKKSCTIQLSLELKSPLVRGKSEMISTQSWRVR